MKAPNWLLPSLRFYALPAIALALFALVVWRQWPIDDLDSDGLMLLRALIGLVCVLGPNDVVYYSTLGGQGNPHMTYRESQTFEDADTVRLIGFVILLDVLWGVSQWLIWTWW